MSQQSQSPPSVDLASLLPTRDNLLRLPVGAGLLLAAEGVDRASWFIWKQGTANLKCLRAANALVKMAVAVSRSPQILIPSPKYRDRSRQLHGVAFAAEPGTTGETLSWLKAVQQLARIVIAVCNHTPGSEDEYDDVARKVADGAAEVLCQVAVVFPHEVREGWASGVRTLVSELQRRVGFSKDDERRFTSFRSVDPAVCKLISDRLVVRGYDSDANDSFSNMNYTQTRGVRDSMSWHMSERHVTSHPAAHEQLADIEGEVYRQISGLRMRFKVMVEGLAGATFGSYEEKETIVKKIKRMSSIFNMEILYEGLPVSVQIARGGGRKGSTGSIQILQGRKLIYSKSSFPKLLLREKNEEENRGKEEK